MQTKKKIKELKHEVRCLKRELKEKDAALQDWMDVFQKVALEKLDMDIEKEMLKQREEPKVKKEDLGDQNNLMGGDILSSQNSLAGIPPPDASGENYNLKVRVWLRTNKQYYGF